MNLVLVAQEKSIRNVAENYKKINTKTKTSITKIGSTIFFERKNSKIPFCGAFQDPRSFVFATKPLLLPIFKNLFFLLFKISSPDID